MDTMTPMERVVAALSHQEADRVPFLLLTTMHPAAARGQTIQDYFSKGENVAEGQLAAQRRFGHDALYGFFYAPIEIEHWGGHVIYSDDGPPNSGAPFIKSAADIAAMDVPDIASAPRLAEVLKAIRLMKAEATDKIPIFGVVMSPFSLPVMQMGFPAYLDLLYEDPEGTALLHDINTRFCIDWANAQLDAGATGIVYFDPVSSPTMVPPELYRKLGKPIASTVISAVNGPVASHYASGATVPIVDDILDTGTVGIGFSADDDLPSLKAACAGKATLIGALDGISMRRWSPQDARNAVRSIVSKAAQGGGLILADNHGEIPTFVPDDVLFSIRDAVLEYGRYPILPN